MLLFRVSSYTGHNTTVCDAIFLCRQTLVNGVEVSTRSDLAHSRQMTKYERILSFILNMAGAIC